MEDIIQNNDWTLLSEKMAKKMRKNILEVAHLGKDGNLQSVFSALDILWVLYDRVLDFNLNNYKKDHDSFVVSKGQIAIGLYMILVEKGFFTIEEVKTFCEFDSRFGLQLDRTKFDGIIENSAGSLGHGLPMAVGMAMANKINKKRSKVYVMVGDGELQEGTMWESFLVASHYNLNNLCVIIDDNKSGNKMLDLGKLSDKFKDFGFWVEEINGHDFCDIYRSLSSLCTERTKIVIAHTKRGYGSKTMMEDSRWFHKAPNKMELDVLLKEVEEFERRSF